MRLMTYESRTNWNKKFGNTAFISIRLHKESSQLTIGDCVRVIGESTEYGIVKLIDFKLCKAKELSTWMTMMDAGLTRDEWLDMVSRMMKRDRQELEKEMLIIYLWKKEKK